MYIQILHVFRSTCLSRLPWKFLFWVEEACGGYGGERRKRRTKKSGNTNMFVCYCANGGIHRENERGFWVVKGRAGGGGTSPEVVAPSVAGMVVDCDLRGGRTGGVYNALFSLQCNRL